MDGGVPLITRELPLGTRRFSEDLQRQHGVTAKDADAMIRGFDRSPNLDAVLQVRADEIAVGIERGAAFLSTSKTVRRYAHSISVAAVPALQVWPSYSVSDWEYLCSTLIRSLV
jgi:type IV pilus assembly protein PilM